MVIQSCLDLDRCSLLVDSFIWLLWEMHTRYRYVVDTLHNSVWPNGEQKMRFRLKGNEFHLTSVLHFQFFTMTFPNSEMLVINDTKIPIPSKYNSSMSIRKSVITIRWWKKLMIEFQQRIHPFCIPISKVKTLTYYSVAIKNQKQWEPSSQKQGQNFFFFFETRNEFSSWTSFHAQL